MLEQVEGNPLACEHHTSGSGERCDAHTRLNGLAISDERFPFDAWVESREHGQCGRYARQHATRFCYDLGLRACARIYGPARRPIAAALILVQSEVNDANRFLVDLHGCWPAIDLARRSLLAHRAKTSS
jgi:hypothetical protein